jgi:hypothetical protein
MTTRSLALCGLAAFGLAACDSADGPATTPETAASAFDAALFADSDQLIATSNQDNAKDNDRVVRFRNPDALSAKAAFFREGRYDVVSFQSSILDESAVEYFGTFDVEGGGRVARFSRQGAQLAVNDAVLVSPKGLDVGFESGVRYVFVADVGQDGIAVHNADDLTPFTILPEPGGRNWDVHWNTDLELLFAAGVDGFVTVYDFDTQSVVDRFQVFDVNGDPAANNHGITYDAESNTLIVSDVGAATTPDTPGFDTDGKINVLDYSFIDRIIGGTTNTPITADATYMGPNTMLGNPVDITGSNDGVFVAEKANGGGRILRFSNVLGATGMQNVAPDAMNNTIQGAESVDAVDRQSFGETPSSDG